jgi:hypothetical protein
MKLGLTTQLDRQSDQLDRLRKKTHGKLIKFGKEGFD